MKQIPYSSFRGSIYINFGDNKDIDSKYYLQLLMQKQDARARRTEEKRFYFNAGFYTDKKGKLHMKNTAKAKKQREHQKNKLLDIAWYELKSRNTISDKKLHNVITPSGFKKRQIRNAKTGKIMGWV